MQKILYNFKHLTTNLHLYCWELQNNKNTTNAKNISNMSCHLNYIGIQPSVMTYELFKFERDKDNISFYRDSNFKWFLSKHEVIEIEKWWTEAIQYLKEELCTERLNIKKSNKFK